MRASVLAVVAASVLAAAPVSASAPAREGGVRLDPIGGAPVAAQCTFSGTAKENTLQVVFAGVAVVTEPGAATRTSVTCEVRNQTRSDKSTTVAPGAAAATVGDATFGMARLTVCVTAIVTWIDLSGSVYGPTCNTP